MPKLIRITTIPLSLEKLLEGQLTYMNQFYEVTAIAAEKDRLYQYGKDNKVKTYWVEMTRAITPVQDVKAVIRLYKYLRKERPLIVHTHTPKAGIVGMLAAKFAGVPLRLHTVAGLPLLETTGLKRSILNYVEKLTYKFATKVYPNSLALKEIILEQKFAPNSKLKVLGRGSSNGIDTSYFNPDQYSKVFKSNLKKDLGIPKEDLVFVFVGRLVKEKGINELVAAFYSLQITFSDISLLLIGPYEEDLDPLTPWTKDTIKEHSKIITTGYQTDVRPYLCISDVLAFPSYREGFPNVVLQAGAMGLPSIVSDINGCNEIITDGRNGRVIPVKDTGALETAMREMVVHPEKRIALARNSRMEIANSYERAEFWRILLKEYNTLQDALEISYKH